MITRIGNNPDHRTIRQILFVCEYQNNGFSHFSVVDDSVQFLSCLVDPIAIGTVHYVDKTLRPRVIVPPERSNFVLSSDVLQSNTVTDTEILQTVHCAEILYQKQTYISCIIYQRIAQIFPIQ